jgi:hypothetical protein
MTARRAVCSSREDHADATDEAHRTAAQKRLNRLEALKAALAQ